MIMDDYVNSFGFMTMRGQDRLLVAPGADSDTVHQALVVKPAYSEDLITAGFFYLRSEQFDTLGGKSFDGLHPDSIRQGKKYCKR
jgi:hypothetical protein